MSVSRSGSSPNVPLKRLQRGSVARSICGDSAVAIPSARYSTDAIRPNSSTREGSKVAAIPRDDGHIEILPPLPASYSAVACAPWRGSEELFAGIPWPKPSTKAWTLLFQRAASSGEETLVMSTARRLSSSRNFFCAAVMSGPLMA